MALASLAAQRSNCMKRRVGCVLVGRERRVISTGYNGTPRGIRNCAEGGCPRCNNGNGSGVGLATCLCIHAEENALLEAGRERIRDGSVLYCDTCPCLTCSIKICQVGITEVVYAHGYSMDRETAAVFSQAGVKLRQFIPVSSCEALRLILLQPFDTIVCFFVSGADFSSSSFHPFFFPTEYSHRMDSFISKRWSYIEEKASCHCAKYECAYSCGDYACVYVYGAGFIHTWRSWQHLDGIVTFSAPNNFQIGRIFDVGHMN